MTESRPKVLSIDDNLSLNSMRQMVLSVSGFDCDLASTAEQALAMVLTCYYDVILMDYYLPGTTGTQVANTIKTLRPEVPIIVVTGEELFERCDAVHIRYLVATQKLSGRAGDVGIDARRITVPDVEIGASQWSAGAVRDARHVEGKTQGNARRHHARGRIGSDIGSIELLVDEVRAFRERGGQDAGRAAARRARGSAGGRGRRCIRHAARILGAGEKQRLRDDDASRAFCREAEQIAAGETSSGRAEYFRHRRLGKRCHRYLLREYTRDWLYPVLLLRSAPRCNEVHWSTPATELAARFGNGNRTGARSSKDNRTGARCEECSAESRVHNAVTRCVGVRGHCLCFECV